MYAPPHKYSEYSGLVNRTQTLKTKYVTTIKNTKKSVIKIILFDQLPLSADGQIKVKLLEPEHKVLQVTNSTTTLEQNNNLKWIFDIAAGSSIDVPLVYTIDFPQDKEIEIICDK